MERRAVVLVAAALLFAGVFLLRQSSDDPDAGVALLYVLPVALTALELGLVAGVGAAALAMGLVGIWLATTDAELSLLGLSTRALVFAAAGGIAGRFSRRMRMAQRRQERLLDSGLELGRLSDADDLAAAVTRHADRVAPLKGVRVTLGDGVPVESGRLEAPEIISLEGRGTAPGTLEFELRRQGSAADEDRAALAVLAQQAAVARENRMLLRSERERVVLQAELREARERLAERARQLRTVLEGQEQERREVAYELHERAAQALAAILLGLELLERDLETGPGEGRLAGLRDHLGATLGSLRDLAVGLRPPVLDGIGLVPALERLGDSGRIPGLERIAVELAAAGRLDPDAETAVYRVVEDAVRTMRGPHSARVTCDPRDQLLTVSVHALDGATVDDLTAVRARLDLLGGSVDATSRELVVRLPLSARMAA
jgi:signal transduction histidine kinase